MRLAPVGGGRCRFQLSERTVEGVYRLVARGQGEREHGGPVLRGVLQRAADFFDPIVVQQRVEVTKAHVFMDEITEAILRQRQVLSQVVNGKARPAIDNFFFERSADSGGVLDLRVG